MASPLGHSLASCYFLKPCAAVNGRKTPSVLDALVLIVLASLPDLDVLLPPFGTDGIFHRTVTHSFFFAAWMGCVLALAQAAFSKGPLLKRAAVYAAVIATHPLVDYFTVIPPYQGAMPLFWPFSSAFFISPIALLPSALTYVGPVPARHSLLRTFGAEAVLIIPLLLLEAFRFWRTMPARSSAPVSLGPEVLPDS